MTECLLLIGANPQAAGGQASAIVAESLPA